MTFDAVGSDGQTYGFNTSYHLGAFTGCTGTSNPTPTGPITFCAGVGFPPGVTVSKVGYSIEGVDVGGSPALFCRHRDSACRALDRAHRRGRPTHLPSRYG